MIFGLIWFLFGGSLKSTSISHTAVQDNQTSLCKQHLIVLSHGLLGTSKDLEYLSSRLESQGCAVLKSSVNELFKSLTGVKTGGTMLADEILNRLRNDSDLKYISFVGNSLGGLFARFACSVLYDDKSKTIAGLLPYKFMTIATPHLGVRNFTYLEELQIKFSYIDSLKQMISSALLSTGQDLFLNDDSETRSLLYKMATDEKFLKPLKAFQQRRIYANLINDFVVPLGTGAFMTSEEVKNLRREYSSQYGIVTIINGTEKYQKYTFSKEPVDFDSKIIDNNEVDNSNCSSTPLVDMILSLNSIGWEKVLVNFKGIIPLSHNKICALTRGPQFLTQKILGFAEGRFVMDHAAAFLSGS